MYVCVCVRVCECVLPCNLKNHYIDLFQIFHNDRFITEGYSQLYQDPELQMVFEKLISKCEEL